MPSTIDQSIDRLEKFVVERGYAGYDPYDALNSRLLRTASLGTKWGRIACIQFLKRCPLNLRPALRVQPGQNPKALGLFLEAYVRLHRRNPVKQYADRAAPLISRLAELRSVTASGHGWGYNFDWQSRVFHLPKYTPTIVCTSFVAHALMDAAAVFGLEQARDLAVPVGDFFIGDLQRTVEGSAFCFSYSALDRYAVHNANLLGASVLIRLYKLTGRRDFRDAALSALEYSLKHQRQDGSWYYSEVAGSHWIDSFHTGFNLESIRHFLNCGEAAHCEQPYRRGVRFYADAFFLDDGTPKYCPTVTYPADIHSAAEAITFFADEGGEFAGVAERVLAWTMRNLADKKGFFYYQKWPHLTNRVAYMRWSQAWMLRALAAYAEFESRDSRAGKAWSSAAV